MKTKEYLKCTLTQDEILEKAQALAKEQQTLEDAELRKKDLVSRIGAEVAGAKTNINTLSKAISNGYEYLQIECEWKFHDPVRGDKTMYRTDTGEQVKTVRMEDSDYQGKLPE